MSEALTGGQEGACTIELRVELQEEGRGFLGEKPLPIPGASWLVCHNQHWGVGWGGGILLLSNTKCRGAASEELTWWHSWAPSSGACSNDTAEPQQTSKPPKSSLRQAGAVSSCRPEPWACLQRPWDSAYEAERLQDTGETFISFYCWRILAWKRTKIWDFDSSLVLL